MTDKWKPKVPVAFSVDFSFKQHSFMMVNQYEILYDDHTLIVYHAPKFLHDYRYREQYDGRNIANRYNFIKRKEKVDHCGNFYFSDQLTSEGYKQVQHSEGGRFVLCQNGDIIRKSEEWSKECVLNIPRKDIVHIDTSYKFINVLYFDKTTECFSLTTNPGDCEYDHELSHDYGEQNKCFKVNDCVDITVQGKIVKMISKGNHGCLYLLEDGTVYETCRRVLQGIHILPKLEFDVPVVDINTNGWYKVYLLANGTVKIFRDDDNCPLDIVDHFLEIQGSITKLLGIDDHAIGVLYSENQLYISNSFREFCAEEWR